MKVKSSAFFRCQCFFQECQVWSKSCHFNINICRFGTISFLERTLVFTILADLWLNRILIDTCQPSIFHDRGGILSEHVWGQNYTPWRWTIKLAIIKKGQDAIIVQIGIMVNTFGEYLLKGIHGVTQKIKNETWELGWEVQVSYF